MTLITGTAGADTLTGTGGDDSIAGLGGADAIDGGAGTDTADYSASASGVTVNLTTGVNTGGDAQGDTLAGIENLIGSAFDDTLTGDAGDNVLEGFGGSDFLDGQGGVDTASYASASGPVSVTLAVPSPRLKNIENLTGSSFNDVLEGDAGDNVINGGAGSDTVSYETFAGLRNFSRVIVSLAIAGPQDTGGGGVDTLISIENVTGTVLNDIIEGNAGDNVLSGGAAGIDTVSYASATAGVTVDLGTSLIQDTVGAGRDTLSGFENVTGSAFDDTLLGNAFDNTFDGGAGNDTVSYARSGNAVTVALDGFPQLITGGGVDTFVSIENLTGSAFDDTLAGNSGANVLNGGAGLDTVSYAKAAGGVRVNLSLAGPQDTFGAGTDTLVSIENLVGSAFNDTLTGDAADNVLNGGLGDDILDGQGGINTASYAGAAAGVNVSLAVSGPQNTGGAGTDTLVNISNLIGSAFDDVLGGNYGGTTVLDGGAGFDIVSYAGIVYVPVQVNLSLAGQQETLGGGADTLISIEGVIGTALNDILTGNAGNNLLDGGDGDDVIDGRGGDDTLIGGAGVDTLLYVSATSGVTVSLANALAQNTGGAGVDTLSGFENVTGSAFNDTITGDGQANVLIGGLGDDTLDGSGGVDTTSYAGAASAVTVSLAAGGAQNTGGAGTDTLLNIENLIGSSFNDTLGGTAGDNVIDGGAGIDTVSYADATSGVRVNLAWGGAQDTGGAGVDSLISIENVTGSSFDDTLSGGAGDSVLIGGAGNDTVSYDWAGAVAVSLAITGSQDTGGSGTDTLLGFENLTGSSHDDVLAGDAGANIINGGAGKDTVSYAGATSAVIVNLNLTSQQNTGGGGLDTLINIENVVGSDFNDTIAGNFGDNVLSGGAGVDTISFDAALGGVTVSLAKAGSQNTGAGFDTLSGFENLTGSRWNDVLEGTAGDNILDGGDNIDTVSYASATAAVSINLLLAGPQNTLGAGVDTLISFENVLGSAFNDTLVGGADALLIGGGGADILDGTAGNVTAGYLYATSAVSVDLGHGTGTGEAAGDTFISIENVTGSTFADSLVGDSNRNILDGGAGNDTLDGADGADVLIGGAGDDWLIGGADFDTLQGGAGADTLVGGAGTDIYVMDDDLDQIVETDDVLDIVKVRGASYTLNAGAQVEWILADSSVLTGAADLTGNEFNQTIEGNNGVNRLFGGGGDDSLGGHGGADILTGGAGKDRFWGSAADLNGDTITDFSVGEEVWIDMSFAGFSFSQSGSTVTYTGGTLTFANLPSGYHIEAKASYGGVSLTLAQGSQVLDNGLSGDFNGDGKDDLLWRSDSGQLSNWLGKANGGFIGNDANAFVNVPTTWHVVAAGDFNGDGRDDIVWRSDSGQMSDWLGTASGGWAGNDANALAVVDPSWKIIGAGDFNGDGREDILWRSDAGQLSNWLGQANGGFVGNDANAFASVPNSWRIVGVGDFNGDGRDDILWRAETGQLSNWLGTASGGWAGNDANAFVNVPTDWHVVGVGDFNGDGRSDILWRSDVGQLSNWLGTASGGWAANDANAFASVPTDWVIAAVGDYNGDGRDDIMWRHTSGAMSNWLGTASGGWAGNDANAYAVVDPSWRIQADGMFGV